MDDTLLMKFIGPNAAYFIRKWQALDVGGRRNSWNWSALFFSIAWLSYRKMYGCAVFFSLSLLLILYVQFIFKPLIIYRIVSVAAIPVFLAVFGNRMYQYHIGQRLTEIYGFYPTDKQLDRLLFSIGGVDVTAATMTCLSIAVAIYFLFALFNLLPMSYDPLTIISVVLGYDAHLS